MITGQRAMTERRLPPAVGKLATMEHGRWPVSRRVTLALLMLALLVEALLHLPQPAMAAMPPRYNLDVTLEYATGLLTARETVAFTNRTSQDLDSLVFTVTPAHYGAFQLDRAAIDAQEVKASLDGSIMDVPALQPVRPGSTVLVTLDFKVKVPVRGGRFGRGSQAIALGNWFPILAVYRDGRLMADGQERGWVRGKYVEMGDAFFSEASDFVVTLRTDQPVQVAHTGDLVSRSENSWTFAAMDVRDFAMAISTSFNSVSRTIDGIDIRVFYLPGHQAAANTYLEAAAETAGWLKGSVAPYPYRRLDIAEINGEGSTTVGQEYPGLIFMANSIANTAEGPNSYGGTLASHEAAHQWFYGIIGNDQLYEPWMDEAMATWLSYYLIRIDDPATFAWIWLNRVVSPAVPDLPVNTSIYTYADEGPYLALAYRRGAVFLEELYQTMGADAFFAALKDYAAAMSGRVGTPYAFLDTMQARTKANLNPLIARYFSYARYTAAEPLRVSTRYPRQPWSGTIRLSLDSDAPLQDIQVFVDDVLYMRALPSQVMIDTAQVDEGEHLLTLRASDGRREADLISTFSVRRPAPTPAPPPPVVPAVAIVEAPEVQPSPPPPVESAAPPAAPASDNNDRTAGVILVVLSIAVMAWAIAISNTARR